MYKQPAVHPPDVQDGESPCLVGNLSDLVQELRVLLQAVQVLTGFLIILTF